MMLTTILVWLTIYLALGYIVAALCAASGAVWDAPDAMRIALVWPLIVGLAVAVVTLAVAQYLWTRATGRRPGW